MIKVSAKKGFYDSATGKEIVNIKSVSIIGLDDVVITVVYKDSVPYVYLPQKNTQLFKLSDVIDKMGYVVLKVA